MTPVLVVAVLAAAALLAAAGAVVAVLGAPPPRSLLQALFGLQLLLLAQLAVLLYFLAQGDRPREQVAFAGYVVLSLLLLPGGLALSADERSRWGTLVLAVASAVVAVVEARLVSTWR